MKKILVSSALSLALIGALNAASLDTKSFSVSFEGYKTPQMVATAGEFKSVKYKFGKDKTSIKGLLDGASATLSPKNIDMGVDEVTNNIVNVFFKTLNNGQDFNVEIINVTEADNQGLISAKVTIGSQYEIIPLYYTIKEGNFEAKGFLDLAVFSNSAKALKALSDAAPGHQNLSWSLVQITLNAKVK